MSARSETLVIEKRIALSPGHRVMPHRIVRALNNDLIVLGSTDSVSDFRAWATRLTASGEVRWDFLEGGPNGWEDQSVAGQRFYGAVDLPDDVTLLCGIKRINRESIVMLVKLDSRGNLLAEKLIPPVKADAVISLHSCHRHSDGIVLMGTSSGLPAGTAWMSKIDWDLNPIWTKFNPDFGNGDYIERGESITALGWHVHEHYVVNIDRTGEVTAKHILPAGDHRLVQDLDVGAPVRVVLALSESHNLEILDFDNELQREKHLTRIYNVGVSKALSLSEMAVVILGTQNPDGPTATVTKVYKGGGYKTFSSPSLHESPWFIDGVRTDRKDEIAAVRQVGIQQGVLEFLAIK